MRQILIPHLANQDVEKVLLEAQLVAARRRITELERQLTQLTEETPKEETLQKENQ